MKRNFLFTILLGGCIFLLPDCADRKGSGETTDEATAGEQVKSDQETYNILTEEELQEGWQLLFDGETTGGWRGFNEESIGDGWTVMDGNLVSLGKGADIGGDIITEEEYENFELKLEWKISPQGNSGILYHVLEGDYPAVYATGPEYQLIDDLDFPEPLEDLQTTGANYGMHPPAGAKIKPAGEWNSSRILIDGDHVEHWLNGSKVVEYTLWDTEWNELVQSGKWNDYPDYGKARKGHISLQDHGSMIWFRNIKIRVIQ
ncbi:MAG: DUF1080 domain-containing protein [Bacteroidales bacterium]|nr:MAG: DUF1080 domain-containing protein [Bacteroidales bacterium]